jgi:hypothetical protein
MAFLGLASLVRVWTTVIFEAPSRADTLTRPTLPLTVSDLTDEGTLTVARLVGFGALPPHPPARAVTATAPSTALGYQGTRRLCIGRLDSRIMVGPATASRR